MSAPSNFSRSIARAASGSPSSFRWTSTSSSLLIIARSHQPKRALPAAPTCARRSNRSFASSSRWAFEGRPGTRESASEKGKEAAKTYAASTLSTSEYNAAADHAMDTLHDSLEALVEEWSPEGANGWEVEYSAGVLTLSLGPHGTYVINKQPPNKEIWMSSPFSGPARYAYSTPHSTWFYSRDDSTIGSMLDREIRSVLVSEVGKEGEDWEGVGLK